MRCLSRRGNRSLAGQLPLRRGRSRPPCSNTQANDSRPGSHARLVLGGLRRSLCPPPCGFSLPVDSRPHTFGIWGKTSADGLPARVFHRQVVAACEFLCGKPEPRCDQVFLMHSPWIASMQAIACVSCRTARLSTAQSTDCAQACHRLSTSYPQGRVGTRVAGRQNESPRMSDPFGRTVSARGGGVTRGEGGIL